MQYMTLSLKKFKGLNNILPTYDHARVEFVGRTAITEAFLMEAKNLDLTDEFHLRMRKGHDPIYNQSNGNIHSLWSNNDICLLREGINLKYLSTDYLSHNLRENLTPQKINMSYLDLNNKIYYSDGIDTGIVENYTSRSWGLDIPPSPVLTETVGQMRAGTYRIALSYVRNDGQASGTKLPSVITIGENKGISVSNIIPSTDSTVSYINVYISSPDGEALFPYTVIDNANQTFSILGNSLQSGLSLQLFNLVKAPAGSILEYYNGRIWIVSGDVVWYSEPFAYELFRLASNYLMLDSPITIFSAVKDGLWIATEDNTYFFQGDNPPFKVTVKANYGAIRGTLQKISGTFMGKGDNNMVSVWTSKKGICAGYDGGEFKNFTNENYDLPIGLYGTSIFRQERGMNHYLVSLKNIEEAGNIYE